MLARTRPSGEWSEDDYDVLADGIAVGRIFRAAASPEGSRWMWPLAYRQQEDHTPTHGYEPTREGAMTGVREELAAGIIDCFGDRRPEADSPRKGGPPPSLPMC